ncbi:hypothetical protein AWB80_03086 [Caballeronia pedi]|uniref:DUF2591 domain-containing protein n=1 Tax=Caballeronia pedi TaxID=1777141 RepID=A0A158B698_9BURK|nr:phage protein NinX family protein [Caballeronia pedi]SAK65592.1 hypothetical protein AWB80_03086 [Caballeronia pedi]
MNVAQLSGAQLDYWVAKAEGLLPEVRHACGADWCQIDVASLGPVEYQPSGNLNIVAPIAVRQRYVTYPRLRDDGKIEWLAEAQLNADFHGVFVDESLMVAVCRLRVAEVFGYEVSD